MVHTRNLTAWLTACAILAAALPRVAAGETSALTLLWTATGDDADTGRAARYDLRYSTNGVGADIGSWWNAASRAAGLPAPSYAGQIDSTRVAGLIPETDYT